VAARIDSQESPRIEGWEAVHIGKRVARHIGERREAATRNQAAIRKQAATGIGTHQEAAGFGKRWVAARIGNRLAIGSRNQQTGAARE
jgi:hypothetical protein